MPYVPMEVIVLFFAIPLFWRSVWFYEWMFRDLTDNAIRLLRRWFGDQFMRSHERKRWVSMSLPEDSRFTAVFRTATRIVDSVDTLEGDRRAYCIDRVAFLLIDLLKQQGNSQVSEDAVG